MEIEQSAIKTVDRPVRISAGNKKGKTCLRFYITPDSESTFINPSDIGLVMKSVEIAEAQSGLKLDSNCIYQDEVDNNKGSFYLGYSEIYKSQIQIRRMSTGTKGEVESKRRNKRIGYTFSG
jgi:hypothetical protein